MMIALEKYQVGTGEEDLVEEEEHEEEEEEEEVVEVEEEETELIGINRMQMTTSEDKVAMTTMTDTMREMVVTEEGEGVGVVGKGVITAEEEEGEEDLEGNGEEIVEVVEEIKGEEEVVVAVAVEVAVEAEEEE